MTANDRAYFQYRAEIETERAVHATDPSAVQAHYRLAQAYLNRLFSSNGTAEVPAGGRPTDGQHYREARG